jgi:hypothetical protein
MAMAAPAIGSAFRRAKYVVGSNLRKLGIRYSKKASVQMWRERADNFAAQGKIDEALGCRRKAVELAPANKDLHIELARELVLANRREEIKDAEGCNALGYYLLNGPADDSIKAEVAFRMALAHSPDIFDAFLGLSECLARRRRLYESQVARNEWFRRWIKNSESDGLRRRQEKACRRGIPAVVFVAMMKSASEFIRENLIRAFEVPEIHLSIGTVPRDEIAPSAVRQLAKGGAISRSHISANNLPGLIANGVERLVLHVRDPRQVVVSWVHHMRRISEDEFRWSALRYDPLLPTEFRNWVFDRQLDWAVRNYLPGQLQWVEDWISALNAGPPIPILVTQFEEFVRDQHAFFRKIYNFYEVSEIRMPNLRKQTAAAMRNFRNGHIDEWRAVLTGSQISQFRSRIEPLARHFGWELEAPVNGLAGYSALEKRSSVGPKAWARSG